ncbi:ATP-binding protein [uncultured Roseovarius sp.]|uniref:ATP-binding protein n=1 Tax=uncultured Roseovarius sp. TaxID=293344 RepID=UPI0025E98BD6|nr:ATP-binding protein [uncultured Roseovarius sp.]
MSAHIKNPKRQISELSSRGAELTRTKRWIWPLQRQIAAMLVMAIAIFATVIQLWNYRTFMSTEIERTQEKHLVIAQNMSLSLSRYVTDVARVFAHAAQEISNNDSQITRDIHLTLLNTLNVESMVLLPAFGEVSAPRIRVGKDLPLPEEVVLDDLRLSPDAMLNGVQISGLQQIRGERYFILGYELPDQRLAIGYMNTDYIKEIQQAIAFGEFGHSAIFDQYGRAVAHPSPKVEENMVDASGISAVRRMLNRETGVEVFFSPPMQMDMIAGITFVPETGWPVMVPQPIYELSDAVNGSLSKSYLLALSMAVLLGSAGWVVSRRLARPVRRFTEISSKISDGDYTVTLPYEESSSTEMCKLNESLKSMINQVRSSDNKLREALRLEEEENKRKSDFLVIAGHELRTPLSGVLGMLTICREQRDDEDFDKYLDVAWTSARALNGLVDHMVDFAEGTTGSIQLKKMPFDIEAKLREMEALYKSLARNAGLDFQRTGLGDGSTMIVSDPERLSQIISKIMENAIKFTKDGGISLNSEILQQDERKLLKITISDTGIGIKESELERIFMPFEQVEASFTRSYCGMGIGLSVAQEISKMLGGSITCESKLHEGTRFEIWIPIELA